MKNLTRILFIAILLLTGAAGEVCHGQNSKKKQTAKVGAAAVWGEKKGNDEMALKYIIEGKDTIYIDNINPSKVYSRLPKQKGREWRKYYKIGRAHV